MTWQDRDVAASADQRVVYLPGSRPPSARNRTTVRAAVTANLLLALWLLVTPWVFGYSSETAAVWNQLLVGLLVAACAAARLWAPARRPMLSWLSSALGLWILFVPIAIEYEDPSARTTILGNDVMVGFLLFLLGTVSAIHTPRSDPPVWVEE